MNTSKSDWQITSVDTTWSNYSFNYTGSGKVTYLAIDGGEGAHGFPYCTQQITGRYAC